jgi:glycosyltransferase involved in cell wall biosynthesis
VQPFFSIVTISYNQGSFLLRCLQSVACQAFISYEHIIVDPGSSDNSRALVLAFDSPYLIPVFESDEGPADGLNKGFARARGQYILFINADDYLLEDSLSLIYSHLIADAWPDILFMGGYIESHGEGNGRCRIFPGSTSGMVHSIGLSQFFQQGTVIKSALFRSSSGFNLHNRTCWDGELVLQYLALPDIRVRRHKDTVAVFVIHEYSITGTGRNFSQYILDWNRAVVKSYGFQVLAFKHVVCSLPRVFRLLLKYLIDPRLAYWRATSLVKIC